MSFDISLYMDRLATLQQASVANSIAYAYYAVQQRNDLYFVNRLGAINTEVIGAFQRRYSVEIQTAFRVALVTQTSQTGHYEIECQQYIFDIMQYFQKRPSLTVASEPTSETPLTYMVPRSLSVTSTGVQAIGEGSQTAIGSFFTFNFSVNLDGDY